MWISDNLWDYPKVCVNLQTDVRQNYSVWRFYYGRKKRKPAKAAMRDMMHSYLKDNDIRIKNGASEKFPLSIFPVKS